MKLEHNQIGLLSILVGIFVSVFGGIICFLSWPEHQTFYLIGFWVGVAGFVICLFGIIANFMINSENIFGGK